MNMERISYKLLIVLFGVLLFSCSDKYENEYRCNLFVPSNSSIYFSTEIECNPLQSKGAQTTTLNNFGVFAYYTGQGSFSENDTPNYMYNQSVSRVGNTSPWTYAPAKYWPANATAKISFFAYSPMDSSPSANGITVPAHTAIGTPTLAYIMPEVAANQPDLLVAVPQKDKTNPTSSSSKIELQFKHALACIGFSLKGTGEHVTKISLQGIYTSGTLSMDCSTGILWSDTTVVNRTTLYDAGINLRATTYVVASSNGINKTDLMKADGYLMVIPQTITDDVKLVVTLLDGSTRVISIKETTHTRWSANGVYIYSIKLTT